MVCPEQGESGGLRGDEVVGFEDAGEDCGGDAVGGAEYSWFQVLAFTAASLLRRLTLLVDELLTLHSMGMARPSQDEASIFGKQPAPQVFVRGVLGLVGACGEGEFGGDDVAVAVHEVDLECSGLVVGGPDVDAVAGGAGEFVGEESFELFDQVGG